MKKLLPFLLLLALVLCACSSSPGLPNPSALDPNPAPSQAPAADPTPDAAPTPAAEVTPEPPPPPAETPEPVVIYDAYCKTGSYSDSLDNHWNYVLRIPAIQAPGSDATRLNQEIYTALYPHVKDALDAMEGMYSLGICNVDYVVYINGSLISIVSEVDTDWGFESYYTVNYDAEAKTEVTRAALLERYGLDEEAFLNLASKTVDNYFQENYSFLEKDAFWQDRHDQSVARENFSSDCQLFVNDKGQLCMIFKLYSFAGADYYYQIFVVK